MNNSEDSRIKLLRSLAGAVSLFETLQIEFQETRELDAELCTKLELEIVGLIAAVQGAAGIVPTDHSAKNIQSRLKKATSDSRKPDYVHWSRLAYWTEYDAVALAAGCDPELVDWTESNRLLEWVRAAVEQGALPERISPAAFMHWVDRLGDSNVSLPEELRQAIEDHQSIDFRFDQKERTKETHHSTIESISPEYDPDSKSRLTVTPRTFHTTQKLLAYFMNSAGLIDLSSDDMPSHSQAAEIAEKMAALSITDKTVLKHLKDAAMTARQAMKKIPRR